LGGPRAPTARLKRFAPIFPVADHRRALAHYQTLGFESLAYQGGDDYGFAERDGVGLHLFTTLAEAAGARARAARATTRPS
jgi:hypothetical protein